MKNNVLIIISLILVSVLSFVFMPKEGCKVLKIDNPATIYLDLNNNYIFDEEEPVTVKNISFIDKNSDYSENSILKSLTYEQKVLLDYKSKELSENLLKNKHVKFQDNDIIINNKKYSDTMLESKLVYNNNEETQKQLVAEINKINTDDFVIYNNRSKKYHKLGCEEAQKIANFKIINKSSLDESASPCKACHNLFNKKVMVEQQKVSHKKENHSYTQTPKNNGLKSRTYKDNFIGVFFIDLNEIYTPSNKCKHPACEFLKHEIDNSKTSIDFAIYGINNQPEIVNALINAQNRGVKIRWIYDVNKSSQNYYEDNEKLAKIIPTFKTDEDYENRNSSAIMHNKFFIFDGKKVWTGSANITTTDLSGFNANFSILIESEALARIYTNEFEQMYNGKFHKYKQLQEKGSQLFEEDSILIGKHYIKPAFSPQNDIANKEIIPLIKEAKVYIYMPIFFISHKGIANALIEAKQRGVDVKVIHDATNSHANNSTHKLLRNNGVSVKTENYAGKMHMKSMVIDDEISVIGSMNFTNSGNNKNDENVLIIRGKDIAKFVKNNFLYLWDKIPEKYAKYDPRAESFESIGSCEDGIDNNFDNKIDMNDEGCKMK